MNTDPTNEKSQSESEECSDVKKEMDATIKALFDDVMAEVEARPPRRTVHRFVTPRSLARARKLKVKAIQKGMVQRIREIMGEQEE